MYCNINTNGVVQQAGHFCREISKSSERKSEPKYDVIVIVSESNWTVMQGILEFILFFVARERWRVHPVTRRNSQADWHDIHAWHSKLPLALALALALALLALWHWPYGIANAFWKKESTWVVVGHCWNDVGIDCDRQDRAC